MLNLFFIGFIAITLVGLLPYTYYIKVCGDKFSASAPEGYDYPKLTDFGITVVSAAFFMVAENCKGLFKPLVAPICKTQDPDKAEEKERRVNKMATCVYKALFFIGSSIWGYKVTVGQDWVPTELGGLSTERYYFKGFPYQEDLADQKMYLLVTMGYHFGSLLNTFVGERRTDFLEMTLHHFVTCYLYGGSYLHNTIHIAVVIAYLHDLADITANLLKLLAETKFGNVAGAMFFTHLALWGYTRNYLFAIIVYDLATKPVPVWD